MPQRHRQIDTNLRVGERLGISFGHETTYPTLLEDVQADGHLVISVPIYRGTPINMRQDQQIVVFFYRENGLYHFDARVRDFLQSGVLRLIVLERLSEPLRQQRRESFRLVTLLDVQMRLFAGSNGFLMDRDEEEDDPWEITTANNISETGVSVYTQREYEKEDQVQVRLRLPQHKTKIDRLSVLGVIRQVEHNDYQQKKNRVGIEFLALTEEMRHSISRFILFRQQQILRAEARDVDE